MDSVLEDVLVELLVDLPADADGPIGQRAERTWIWSDLHLSEGIDMGWDRPFGAEEMNRHLLELERRVGADDTIICLGDVAHPDAWRDDRLVLRPNARASGWSSATKDVPALRRAGFHKTCRTALCATDPPLVSDALLSHRTVNVHPPARGRRADRPARPCRSSSRLHPGGADVRSSSLPVGAGTERRRPVAGFAVGSGAGRSAPRGYRRLAAERDMDQQTAIDVLTAVCRSVRW